MNTSNEPTMEKGPIATKTMPQEEQHILDTFLQTVRRKPDQPFASWYDDRGKQTDGRTFADLWRRSEKIARYLREDWKVPVGGRVVLCFDFGLHFFDAFVGCLRAGIVAVLVYPPGPPLAKSLDKLAKVIADCHPALILTDSRINRYRQLDTSNVLSKTRKLWPTNIEFKATDKLSTSASSESSLAHAFDLLSETEVAFLQYTSGSTGSPKAVMVTFRNLAHNVSLTHYQFRQFLTNPNNDNHAGFSWLPIYHDMGLVINTIAPFAAGWHMHLMSPISFIKNPLLWMELMSECRATWTMAPDFAFRLAARKYQEAQQHSQKKKKQLDLSCIEGLASAAEPVRPDTKALFEAAYGDTGLPQDRFGSGYGLAENVVATTIRTGWVLSDPRPDDAKQYVSCGRRSIHEAHLSIKIVDPSTRVEVADGTTGEVWIHGDSMAAGYYGKPALSAETFEARLSGGNANSLPYLRTGDLGFFQGDNMFICGRIKDLIIVGGSNYYPQDIEFVCQDASPAVKPGCVAAFASEEIHDESSLEVVFEIRPNATKDAQEVCNTVRDAIVQRIGLQPTRVVAIADKIRKTTSGKISRRATREALHKDGFKVALSLDLNAQKNNPHELSSTLDDLEAPLDEGAFHAILGEIFECTLGHGINEAMTWEELGLSSMASVEIRNLVSDRLLCSLSPTYQEDCPTPHDLRLHLLQARQHDTFPVSPPSTLNTPTCDISWLSLKILQGMGIVLLLLLIAFTFVPAYQVGKVLAPIEELNHTGERGTRWQWIPLVVPMWMLTVTAVVVGCKWIIIGRYQERNVAVPSTYYLRWWFVDRLVHVWETWIGSFLLDTPLLWLFYWLLGVKLHPTVQVKAFIREFDLVEIGAHSSIKHSISCRRFRPWLADCDLHLAFRPISIGRSCTVEGMIGLGSTIGDDCHIEKLSVLREGSQVPDCKLVQGRPARGTPRREGKRQTRSNSEVGLTASLKIAWLFLEVYFFAASFLFCQWLLNGRLPVAFRYTPLLFWCLAILFQALMSMATTVALKWLLLGKVQPGESKSSVAKDMMAWVVDYRYMVTLHILATVASNSKITNLYLKALGMDIDMASHVFAYTFFPSEVDLVSVKQSFLSAATIEPTTTLGEKKRIAVKSSSLGYGAVLRGGTDLDGVKAPPLSVIEGQHKSSAEKVQSSLETSICSTLSTELFYIVMLAALFLSAIPAFEIVTMVPLTDASGVGFSVVKLATAMLVQTLVWLVMYRALQWSLIRKDGTITCEPLYTVYLTVTYNFIWVTSLMHLAYGTGFMEDYLRFMGAKVRGRVIYFADQTYDASQLTFLERCVIDKCNVNAHSVVYNKLMIAPVAVSGVLHQGTVVLANTDMSGAMETGPYCFHVSKNKVAPQSMIDLKEEVIEETMELDISNDGMQPPHSICDGKATNSSVMDIDV